MKELFKDLPKWSQGVIAISAVAGIGFIAFKLYQGAKRNAKLEDSQTTADDAKSEYQKLVKQGKKLSFSPINYQTASNSVVVSLAGCETYIGEESAIKAVMDVVKKPIDWYYLVYIFGSKMVEGCGWGSGETAYALPELLKDQLGQPSPSAYYLKTTLTVLEEYLKKIGVTI